MIFVSKGYFKSANCLREARCTVAKRKPITLVHDPASYLSTYMPLETIRDDECPDELRLDIFGVGGGEREVIPWHRIYDFQLVSLKLLAEHLLLGCPREGNVSNLRRQSLGTLSDLRRKSLQGKRDHIDIFVPGELQCERMALPRPRPVVYASPHNPGALAVAADLAAGMGRGLEVTVDSAAIQAEGGTRAVATHFLLYLNDRTYLGEAGKRLAEELRAVRAEGVEVVMVHENDLARGGCSFGIFFDGRTPQDLLQEGLYKALALALYSDDFWPVSVALVATAGLGAHRGRGRGSFTTGAAVRSAPVAPETAEVSPLPPPEETEASSPERLQRRSSRSSSRSLTEAEQEERRELRQAEQALWDMTSPATCLKDRPERESRILVARAGRLTGRTAQVAAQQPSPVAPEQRRLTVEEARLARIADFEGLGFPKTEEEARLARVPDFEGLGFPQTEEEARLARIADFEAAVAARTAERPVREEPRTVWSPAVKRQSHATGMVASRGKPGRGDETAAAREVAARVAPLLRRSLSVAEQEERRELRQAEQAEQAVAVAVRQGGVEPLEGWPELITPEKKGSIVLSI